MEEGEKDLYLSRVSDIVYIQNSPKLYLIHGMIAFPMASIWNWTVWIYFLCVFVFCFFFFAFFLFFFPLLGIESELQLQPIPQLQQHRILNPLHWTWDQTCRATKTTLSSFFFFFFFFLFHFWLPKAHGVPQPGIRCELKL